MADNTIEFSPANKYFLRLIRCAINAEPVPEKPEEVSWEWLFRESKRHNVSLLVFDSVKKLSDGPKDELQRRWQTWEDKLLTKGINQTLGCQSLTDDLNRAGVKVLPMKGYYIRRTYPIPERREMTDIDVLVDRDPASEEMQQLMASLGYEMTESHSLHTAYTKKPYLMVEMHSKLLPDYVGHGDYYDNIWERAISETERPCVCHLSASDTLIHILLHFYKHYIKNSSCGIRFSIDFFTYCRYYKEKLDWTYINKELEKLGILDVSMDVIGLGEGWFGDGTLTPSQKMMGARMLSSGVFGNLKERDTNEIMKLSGKSGNLRLGKIRFFLDALFPPVSEMKRTYPVLNKAPILLPLTWIARGFCILFRYPQRLSKMIRRTKNAGTDNTAHKGKS